jgi:3-oxoacyl-[acyl-carrier protein] reductase
MKLEMSVSRSNGKAALVTGGSRGIGRAIAERLARDQVLVAVHYGSNEGAAQATVRGIEAAGGRAFPIRAELGSSMAAIDALFDALDQGLRARTGEARFDILINNAGISPRGTIAETSVATFESVFGINVMAPFFIVQRALKRLRDGGRIINISSGVTRIASPETIAYSMTKGAIDVFSRTLAQELGARGITVNAVAAGVTDTDMNAGWLRGNPEAEAFFSSASALGRIGRPEDIADVVASLTSDDCRWVTGQVTDATGGARL